MASEDHPAYRNGGLVTAAREFVPNQEVQHSGDVPLMCLQELLIAHTGVPARDDHVVHELRAYLGLCNYYSEYIKMYAEYAGPMTTMLKGNLEETKKGSKKALVWNAESDRAFEGMKQALLCAVDLHLLDPDRGFVLRTDASDYAVGAVLEQVLDDGRHVPVAFWSRVLAEGQRWTWTPREKQAYAIVMALRKWAGYIALHPVTVCTDHQSLQSWHKEHVDTP